MAVMIEPRGEEGVDPVALEVAGLSNRVSVLEVKVDALGAKVDEGFERVDKRFERIDERFERIDERFERMQWFLLGAVVSIVIAVLGAPHL